MTASPHRRRRSTLVATVVAVGVTLGAAGLAVAGGLTLYNSTEGTSTMSTVPQRVFPPTPTAVLAAVDDEGELASLAVLVGSPSGTGGSIVTVPVNSDATGGAGDERLPLDETFRLDGAASLENEVEVALGLGIDTVEVVDEARLTELLGPIGPIQVDLPDAVTDASGRVIAPAGAGTIEPAEAAAILTARDADQSAALRYPAAVAVWNGLAAVAGAAPVAAGAGTVDAVFAPVMSGATTSRSLTFETPDEKDNPRQVDVVRLDRIELAVVLGQIAPGKLSAPNPALTFRIESPFEDAALGEGASRTQVAYDATSVILFAGGNVLSVSTAAGETPEVTQVFVSDDSLLGEVEGIDALLGPVEIGVAEERIAGVDAVIRLGSSFLVRPGAEAPLPSTGATVAGGEPAETTETAETDTTETNGGDGDDDDG